MPLSSSVLRSCSDNALFLLDDLLGLGVLSGLQVGVQQEVHGVQFVTAHVHRTRLLGQIHRLQVGLNIFLPQSEPREDVRRHVHGVRRRRSDRCIGTCGRQGRRGQLRIVAGVNDVVRQPGMIRVFLEERQQDGNGFLVVRQRGVIRWRRCQQRQRVEGARFHVLGIFLVELAHRVRVGGDALHVISGRGIVVEDGCAPRCTLARDQSLRPASAR